jgi:hypothetical protein
VILLSGGRCRIFVFFCACVKTTIEIELHYTPKRRKIDEKFSQIMKKIMAEAVTGSLADLKKGRRKALDKLLPLVCLAQAL